FSAHDVKALKSGSTIRVMHPWVRARAVSVSEFSGLGAKAVVAEVATATGNGAAITTGSVITTQADELLIGAVGLQLEENETVTPGGGSTPEARAGTVTAALVPEYRIVSAAGSYVADATLANAHRWAAVLIAYRAEVCGNGVARGDEECDEGGPPRPGS